MPTRTELEYVSVATSAQEKNAHYQELKQQMSLLSLEAGTSHNRELHQATENIFLLLDLTARGTPTETTHDRETDI